MATKNHTATEKTTPRKGPRNGDRDVQSRQEAELRNHIEGLEQQLKEAKAELRSLRSEGLISAGTGTVIASGKHEGKRGVVIVPGRKRCLVQLDDAIRPVMVKVEQLSQLRPSKLPS